MKNFFVNELRKHVIFFVEKRDDSFIKKEHKKFGGNKEEEKFDECCFSHCRLSRQRSNWNKH